MILISHRGNINGPIPDKENRPSYIDSAIQLGYDVEVDLRFLDGEFWLGHDNPQYKIELEWMNKRKNNLWFHCKNKDSAMNLIKLNKGFNFFCHSNDDFVLTSNGYLWVHDLTGLIDNTCIIPLLDMDTILKIKNRNVYGICTDHINFLKNEKRK
jgi:hypothetical protein